MKKLIIKLNQTFEIEISEAEIEEMIENGVDMYEEKEVFEYINAEKIICNELDLYANAEYWVEYDEQVD